MARPMVAGRCGGGLGRTDMDGTMNPNDDKKQGILGLERGGQYAKQYRVQAVRSGPMEWKLDTEMASAFAAITGENGTVPSKGVYAIRDRSQHPWRVLARRFREVRDANAPLDQALAPVKVLECWVKRLYGDVPKSAA